MVNAHQLNSLAELNYSGNLRHTQDELLQISQVTTILSTQNIPIQPALSLFYRKE